jgi:AraC-like DNA-binding protein
MANPFFSGRIPAGLAEKIDAHLLVTGETRSELLVRLLRTEVGDNTIDNKPDNKIADLLARVEKLEQLINNKADNKIKPIIDNVVDNKSEGATEQGDNNDDNVQPDLINNKDDNKLSLALTQKELATRLGCSTSTLSRAAKAGEDKWAEVMVKYPDPDRYKWQLPIEIGGKLVSY